MPAEARAINIGPAQRRRRSRFGLWMMVLSAALAAALVGSGAPRWWRLALLLPLWAGALGFFQAREKT